MTSLDNGVRLLAIAKTLVGIADLAAGHYLSFIPLTHTGEMDRCLVRSTVFLRSELLQALDRHV